MESKAFPDSLPSLFFLQHSPEIRHAVLLLTNVEPTLRTEEELQELFKKADSDKSGQLSRSEFMGLYMAIVGERVNSNPLVIYSSCSSLLK
jgi:predicted sugar kinase